MPSSRAFARLPTERPNPSSRGIDAAPLGRVLSLMAREDARVARAVWSRRGALARAARLIAQSWLAGGRIVFVGAGTSGRLGVLEAAELPPTFGLPSARVRAVMAGGRGAVFRAAEGAEDDRAEGARSLRRQARRGDAVIAIAASGITPFARGALARARALGCRTILVTGNLAARGAAEVVVAVDAGPELVFGSTRLKAASAAKMALNAMTTAAMIRLGKVHDGWMVDLRPGSRKLRERSVRVVAAVGGIPPARARTLLAQAGAVKPAVVMARLGLGPAVARRRLAEGGGSLRRALAGGRL